MVSYYHKNIMLKRFGYCDEKLIITPYDANNHLNLNIEYSVNKLRYV